MDNVIRNLAAPVNHVASAYEARSNQLEQRREKEDAKIAASQQQRDNDMLKVFDFAGNGHVEQAKYLAQSKGLDVPDQIFTNADFAKGLSTAGNFYGDDKAGAQRFSMAWMKTREIQDYGERVIAASQIAGAPIDPEDKKFRQQLDLERYKNELKRGDRRQDFFIDAQIAAQGNIAASPDQIANSGSTAVNQFDTFFGGQNQPSANLVGANAPLSVRNNNPGNMRPVGSSSGFQQFNSPQEGLDAMKNDLTIKISGQSGQMKQRFGENYNPTLASVISTWAPPSENDTAGYINFVAQKTGLDPNQTLSVQDVDRIIPAMIQMEGGQQASSYYSNAQPQQQPQNQIPAGLPQGSRMVGTANGRPVYQSPNGERYIDDGNTQNR